WPIVKRTGVFFLTGISRILSPSRSSSGGKDQESGGDIEAPALLNRMERLPPAVCGMVIVLQTAEHVDRLAVRLFGNVFAVIDDHFKHIELFGLGMDEDLQLPGVVRLVGLHLAAETFKIFPKLLDSESEKHFS